MNEESEEALESGVAVPEREDCSSGSRGDEEDIIIVI